MAEGGQLLEDLSRTMTAGSEFYFDYYCYPCHEDDRHVEAFGYCKDCSDYLCEECYKSHRRSKPSRHHVLLDIHQMPKDLTSPHKGVLPDRCTDTCNKHPVKVIEYYCQTHDTMACSACAFTDHRNCENVDHIPDVSDAPDKNKESEDVQNQLRELEGKACRILQDSHDNISVSDKYAKDAVTAVQAYIQEIVSTLDKLKKDFEAETEKLQSENEKRLKAASTRSNVTLLEIRDILQRLIMLQKNKQYCNVFVAVKNAQKTLLTVARDLDRTEHDSMAADFKEKINLQLRNFLHEQRTIGQIAVSLNTFDDNDSNQAGSVIVPADPGHVAKNIPNLVTDTKTRENTTQPSDVISQPTEQNPKKAEENFLKTTTDPKVQDRNKCKTSGRSSGASPERTGENTIKPSSNNSTVKQSGDSSPSSETGSTGNKNISAYDKHRNVIVRHITDIKIKPNKDEENCWISGIAILPADKLIAVDYKNKSIKVIDTHKQKLVYDLKLHSEPWDVTSVDNDKVAVTLPPAYTIQYLNVSTNGIVSTSRSISVNGRCKGIAFARDRFWVTYNGPGKVEMLTLDGEVQLSISADASGQQILPDPQYIAISPAREEIYVSDFNKKAIIRLSSTGTVLSVDKDKDWHAPTGIHVATDGTVYVCDYGGGGYMQAAQCEKKQKLLSRNQTIGHPQGLAYNEATKQLFVSMLVGNIIKVFQLT